MFVAHCVCVFLFVFFPLCTTCYIVLCLPAKNAGSAPAIVKPCATELNRIRGRTESRVLGNGSSASQGRHYDHFILEDDGSSRHQPQARDLKANERVFQVRGFFRSAVVDHVDLNELRLLLLLQQPLFALSDQPHYPAKSRRHAVVSTQHGTKQL